MKIFTSRLLVFIYSKLIYSKLRIVRKIYFYFYKQFTEKFSYEN